MIRAYLSQKTSDSRGKKCIFHMFLTVFPPVYAKRANHSHHSSQSRSILKIDGINLVSCYCERIAPVSLFERATASESPSCHPISTRRVNTLRVHSLRRNLTCVMSRTGTAMWPVGYDLDQFIYTRKCPKLFEWIYPSTH